MTTLPKTLATASDRNTVTLEADRLLEAADGNSSLGFSPAHASYSPAHLAAITDARHRACSDIFISDISAVGPTLDSCFGKPQDGREPTPGEQAATSLAPDADMVLDDLDVQSDVPLLGPEQFVYRKQSRNLARKRRLIEAAIMPCEATKAREVIARDCLRRLRYASNIERHILAAWADDQLRALGFVDARRQIAKAAGCSNEAARILVAKGHAELRAAAREVSHTVRKARTQVKPDLREIEIGSIFDSAASALAISRLAPELQRALVRSIEMKFATSAMETNNATARSKRIKPLSRGIMAALDDLDRSNDQATRDLLGRLDPDLAKRLVAMLMSLRADEMDGIPADSLTVKQYAELIEEVARQISGKTSKSAHRKATRTKRNPRAVVKAPMGAQIGA